MPHSNPNEGGCKSGCEETEVSSFAHLPRRDQGKTNQHRCETPTDQTKKKEQSTIVDKQTDSLWQRRRGAVDTVNKRYHHATRHLGASHVRESRCGHSSVALEASSLLPRNKSSSHQKRRRRRRTVSVVVRTSTFCGNHQYTPVQ